MPSTRHSIEPTICCTLATASLVGYAIRLLHQYGMRDGDFFGAAIKTYPYFLFTPILALAAIYAGRLRSRYGLWGATIIAMFVLVPHSEHFISYWWRCLLPTIWEPLH